MVNQPCRYCGITDDGSVREIPGYPGYFASEDGRIRGPYTWLRPNLNPNGYLQVSVRGRTKRVHVLVCLTFNGPRPAGMEAAHLNGDSTDNRAMNLKWCTVAENTLHKIAHGTSNRGELNASAKLTESDVLRIRERRRAGETIPSIARDYGVTLNAVSYVTRRKTWRHI